MSSPVHVAIIMDGNGRWAQRQGRNRLWGHQKGARALKKVVQACPDKGVRYLTVYAFSTENWHRDPAEVSGLMQLFQRYLVRETPRLHKEGVCLRIIGDRTALDPTLVAQMEQSETLTQHNTRLGLQVALNYGGRDDIVQATQKLATLVQDGHLKPEAITFDHVAGALWTHPWPDPDLLIRTGGEVRLSNYLLWQLSYTELLFFSQCWPDFTVEDFQSAITAYGARKRQFGRHVPSFSTSS